MTPTKTGNVIHDIPFGKVSPESILWSLRKPDERGIRFFDWGAVEDWHLMRGLDEMAAKRERREATIYPFPTSRGAGAR